MKQKSGKLSHQLKAYSSPGISQRGQEAGRELEAGQTKVSQNLGPGLLHHTREQSIYLSMYLLRALYVVIKATGAREMEGLHISGGG